MPRYTVLYESFELKEQLRIRSATAPALLDSKFAILRKHLSPPSDAKSSQLTPTVAHSCSSQGHPCLAGADGPPELLAMWPCTKASVKHNFTCPSIVTIPKGRGEFRPRAKLRPVLKSTEHCTRSDGWQPFYKRFDTQPQDMHIHLQLLPQSWGISNGSSMHAPPRHRGRRQVHQWHPAIYWPQHLAFCRGKTSV